MKRENLWKKENIKKLRHGESNPGYGGESARCYRLHYIGTTKVIFSIFFTMQVFSVLAWISSDQLSALPKILLKHSLLVWDTRCGLLNEGAGPPLVAEDSFSRSPSVVVSSSHTCYRLRVWSSVCCHLRGPHLQLPSRYRTRSPSMSLSLSPERPKLDRRRCRPHTPFDFDNDNAAPVISGALTMDPVITFRGHVCPSLLLRVPGSPHGLWSRNPPFHFSVPVVLSFQSLSCDRRNP